MNQRKMPNAQKGPPGQRERQFRRRLVAGGREAGGDGGDEDDGDGDEPGGGWFGHDYPALDGPSRRDRVGLLGADVDRVIVQRSLSGLTSSKPAASSQLQYWPKLCAWPPPLAHSNNDTISVHSEG